MADGDAEVAAKALGITLRMLNGRISQSEHLNALYGNITTGLDVPELNETGTVTRTRNDLPVMDTTANAEAIMAQDRELMRTALQSAGIKPETIEKMRTLDGLAANSGRMISASVDYTHRLHIFSTAALFEEMIYIRENYLRKENQDAMVTVFWQRAFNEIADLLGKSNDRTMNTAQALAAMMKARSKDDPGAKGTQKAKPGW